MGLKGEPKGDVIVTLPGDVVFPDIKWLSLYCRNFRISFGDIMLNRVSGTLLMLILNLLFSKKACSFSSLIPKFAYNFEF